MSLDVAAGLLTCPHCAQPLDLTPPTAYCPQGHAFDIARHGHLNLLGGPQPRNADTAAMLDARARVLAGLYQPVVALVRDAVAATGARVIVDAGAGTGQYISACLDALPGSVGVACDVSVAAARRAAGAHPRLASVVADTWRRLPLRDGCADLVLCVFAPRNAAEFARIGSPAGRLVVVTPEPGHLAMLRAMYGLLDVPDDKDVRLEQTLGTRFVLRDQRRLTTSVQASADQVADVVAMGPNAFHGVRGTAPGRVEIDVRCRVYELGEPAAHRDAELPDGEAGQHHR